MRTWKVSISLIFLFVIGACHVGPEYERPVVFDNAALEKKLDLQTPAVMSLPFQPQDLKDPLLNELIETALKHAPDIRAARANVEAARAARLASVAGLFPALDKDSGYQYEKFSKNMEQIGGGGLYQTGFVVSWEIDLFGKKRREIEAASAQEQQMLAALENVNVLLVAEVSSAYIGLRTTQLLLAQTKADLKIQKELARLTQDKYHSGLASAIDVNQAEYQLSNTQAVIPKLETEIETYQNALSVLLGEPAGSLKTRLDSDAHNLLQAPFKFQMQKLYALPIEVLRLRPDVRASESALKAQNAEVGVAIASLFPSVSLSALLGLKSVHLHNLLEKDSYTYSYQPSIQTTLFHFGALWQNVKMQEAHLRASSAQYEKTLLQATAEVRNVLVGLKKMKERHADLELAWRKMDKAAQLARSRYKSGLVDYFQVLDAEERRIAAQSALTTSSGLLYQNIINFYKAVGGQFSFNLLKKETAENE